MFLCVANSSLFWGEGETQVRQGVSTVMKRIILHYHKTFIKPRESFSISSKFEQGANF